jgi:hydrogenase maturation protease
MNFASVEKIAAAVLYEGYILYPYRATAIKNRQRWNFGTLYPRIYAEAQRPEEPFRLISECLLVVGDNASLDIKVSFLQLLPQPRTSSNLADPSLDWDEAIERTSDHCDLSLSALLAAPLTLHIKPTEELAASLTMEAHRLPGGACRLHLELQNISPLSSGAEARRDAALPQSLVSAHLLLGVTGGEFVSLLEPPDLYAADARACTNNGVFPVLAGDEPDRSILLLSPIILYDYPKTSPESAGDFFDGTEMDEMLTLRVLTLTDAEKDEMRRGDPRARRILERTESLSGEQILKAHGIVRPIREIHSDTQGDIS